MSYCPIFKADCPEKHSHCEFYRDERKITIVYARSAENKHSYNLDIPGKCQLKKGY